MVGQCYPEAHKPGKNTSLSCSVYHPGQGMLSSMQASISALQGPKRLPPKSALRFKTSWFKWYYIHQACKCLQSGQFVVGSGFMAHFRKTKHMRSAIYYIDNSHQNEIRISSPV